MKTVTDKPCFQGDLCIFCIEEIPADAILAKPENDEYILAHSETGHHHVIERPRAEVFEAADDEFISYVRALGDVKITHKRDFDTHEPILLKPGNYEVRRQREYVPQGFRHAAD